MDSYRDDWRRSAGLLRKEATTISGPDADDDILIQIEQFSNRCSVYVPATYLRELLAPPRPWHYVTDEKPVAGSRLLFWCVGRENDPRNWRQPYPGYYSPDPETGKHWIDDMEERYGEGTDLGEVYAWTPEPEPPPLPEPLPAADEVYGILSPAHPVSGGAGFDQDGKEAAGPPADPDLLQALKDAARMERNRPGVKP